MYNRRTFLLGSGAAASLPLLQGCSDSAMQDYEYMANQLRVTIGENPDILEFVRYATLAANGHNTQPWLFKIGSSKTSIFPDLTRRTPVVDPDDHHLYVSLGCAAENFILAAQAHGRTTALVYNQIGEGRLDINLARGREVPNSLYKAIPHRQSTRSDFDGRPVSVQDLRKLESAAKIDGVDVKLITDKQGIEDVLDFVVAGNSAQMNDPHFIQELKDWIRFNPQSAMTTKDGLFSACSGQPTLPSWIGTRIFRQFFTIDAENEKYTSHLRSSAGVAVFTGASEDRDHWIKVGQSFQRFALQATSLGIRNSHINQPIEVTQVRREFARWLGAKGSRPDLIIRFGYAPPLLMSMRRSVFDTLSI